MHFGSPRLGHTIKGNCIKLQTVDLEICPKRVCNNFLRHIVCMILQEKDFSRYIQLTDQI